MSGGGAKKSAGRVGGSGGAQRSKMTDRPRRRRPGSLAAIARRIDERRAHVGIAASSGAKPVRSAAPTTVTDSGVRLRRSTRTPRRRSRARCAAPRRARAAPDRRRARAARPGGASRRRPMSSWRSSTDAVPRVSVTRTCCATGAKLATSRYASPASAPAERRPDVERRDRDVVGRLEHRVDDHVRRRAAGPSRRR